MTKAAALISSWVGIIMFRTKKIKCSGKRIQQIVVTPLTESFFVRSNTADGRMDAVSDPKLGRNHAGHYCEKKLIKLL
jgi:hypothetical protein